MSSSSLAADDAGLLRLVKVSRLVLDVGAGVLRLLFRDRWNAKYPTKPWIDGLQCGQLFLHGDYDYSLIINPATGAAAEFEVPDPSGKSCKYECKENSSGLSPLFKARILPRPAKPEKVTLRWSSVGTTQPESGALKAESWTKKANQPYKLNVNSPFETGMRLRVVNNYRYRQDRFIEKQD